IPITAVVLIRPIAVIGANRTGLGRWDGLREALRDVVENAQGGITDKAADRVANHMSDRAAQAHGQRFERGAELIESPRQQPSAGVEDIADHVHDGNSPDELWERRARFGLDAELDLFERLHGRLHGAAVTAMLLEAGQEPSQ